MSHYTDEQSARRKRQLARELKRIERETRRKAILERRPFLGLQVQPTASVEDDAEGREPGDTNWSGFGFDLHPHVTFISAAVLVVFILLTLMFDAGAEPVRFVSGYPARHTCAAAYRECAHKSFSVFHRKSCVDNRASTNRDLDVTKR